MAITSKGYSGTVNYADWAQLASMMGAQYSVFGADAFKATAGTGDRQVKIATGTAAGQGILDVSDSTVTLTGGTVASGSRWDMIVLRRDWAANSNAGQSSLTIIPGTGSKAIPTRQVGAGTKDDQPLWLVRFTAGQTAPQEFVDLRCWHGDGGVAAKDMLARDYLTRIGTRVWIQGVTWVLGFNSAGTATWVPDTVVVSSTQPAYAEGLGWIRTP